MAVDNFSFIIYKPVKIEACEFCPYQTHNNYVCSLIKQTIPKRKRGIHKNCPFRKEKEVKENDRH